MPDSIRVKEIHAAIGASEYQAQVGNVNNPINLWYFVQRIARILGISVNEDRTIRPIRQRAAIPHGKPIPAGWRYGQFDVNEGEKYQKGTDPNSPALGERDGIAIEGIPNKFATDVFNRKKTKVEPGDTILCENIPQLIAELMDQLDKAMGLQEAGAFQLPNANGRGQIARYEGLHQLLADTAFTASKISENTSRTEVSSQITQAIVKEILQGLGLPISPKTFPIETAHGIVNVPYPALSSDAPSIMLAVGGVLIQVGTLMGQELKK